MPEKVLKIDPNKGRRLDDLTAAREPLRLIVIGPPKIGKSVCLTSAPKPMLVLSMEGGMQSSLGTPDTVEYKVTDWSEVELWREELRRNPNPLKPWGIDGPVKSVGWDSVTEMYGGPLRRYVLAHPRRGQNEDPDMYGQRDYGRAMDVLLDEYRLWKSLPVNIIITSEIGEHEAPDGKVIHTAKMSGQLDFRLPYAMDWVLYLGSKMDGTTMKRVGYIGTTPGVLAGNRIPVSVANSVPKQIEEPSIPKILELIDGAYKKLAEDMAKVKQGA